MASKSRQGTVVKPQPKKKGAEFDPEQYVKPNLPKEEVLEIKNAFDIFDNDKSGSIDPAELK